MTFANYRMAIGRQTYKDLKLTTMQTFFKLMPHEFIESHNEQDGITIFKNGSMVYWMHLDNIDENTLRGLEINAFLGDQAEEFEENVYLMMKNRVGRWDDAVVPTFLIEQFPDWPRNELTGKFVAPSYVMLLCNPDNQFHFIFRKFHPESQEREPENFFVEAEWDTKLGSKEAYEDALKNDPEYVEKYVRGKWGRSSASIHYLPPSAILEPSEWLLKRIKERGNLFRVLDHGQSAPTCCLWFAALDGVYICYREYYTPGKVISYHRQSIHDLSENEVYSDNFADPQIFKKESQKSGGFWSVAEEYKDEHPTAPKLYWNPADNNEFATRNRINELLETISFFTHPVTQAKPATGLYFIRATENYLHGCRGAITQIQSQRKKVLGTFEGKTLYSDDRDEGVEDHAYDCVRYFVAMHGTQPDRIRKAPPRHSFAYFQAIGDILKSRALQAASVGAEQ